jgi:hypothetical protein
MVPGADYIDISYGSGSSLGYDIMSSVRNSSEDERLPALVSSSAAVGDFWAMYSPWFTGNGPGAFDLWGELTGLKPETTYSVVMAQMWLDVNADLDQNGVLVGKKDASADELKFMAGTPTGYPDIVCNFSAFSNVSDVTNPVMLGTVTSDADGNATVDCLPTAVGNSPWWTDDSVERPDDVDDPTKAPFGDNRTSKTLSPGQFNYIMLYEGVGTATDPIPTESPTVRVQVGPDIDQDGNVVNNGLKPYPTDLVDDPTSKPGGAESFPAPGVVKFDVTGLATLGGKQYTIWLFDRSSGSYALAEGSEIVIDGGEATTGSSFDSPGAGSTISVNVAPGTDFSTGTHVVLSMEAGAAGSPTETKFMFKEYLTVAKSLADGAMTFGGFNGGTNDYRFLNAGSGTAEFISVSAGRQLQADLRRLPQPPQGFHYTSYIVELIPSTPVTEFARANEVVLDALGNGQDIIPESTVGSFNPKNTYVAMLEPDGLQVLTPHFVQVSENYQFKFVDFFPR